MPEFRFREPMSNTELPPNARLVYYWLRVLAGKDDVCSARVSEIADRVGISEPTCSTQISALEDAGYVARVSAKGLGTGRKRFKILSFFVATGTALAIGTAEPSNAASLDAHRAAVSQGVRFETKRRRRKPRVTPGAEGAA
jgi:DNA-binding transcriptional ArsR family regulator